MEGKQYGILVNLDRCVGCYACEVACKQENNSSPGTPWIRVNNIGPELVNGEWKMDFVPLISDGCTFYQNCGLQPSCVNNCPTKALRVYSTESMLDAISGGKRHQICIIKELKVRN